MCLKRGRRQYCIPNVTAVRYSFTTGLREGGFTTGTCTLHARCVDVDVETRRRNYAEMTDWKGHIHSNTHASGREDFIRLLSVAVRNWFTYVSCALAKQSTCETGCRIMMLLLCDAFLYAYNMLICSIYVMLCNWVVILIWTRCGALQHIMHLYLLSVVKFGGGTPFL